MLHIKDYLPTHMFYLKMFKDFLTILGFIKMYNFIKNNCISFYESHVFKYYLEHTVLNNDVETNKKILKLIKIKLFFDFVLNIHLVDNKAVNVNKNDILYHNYFNDFHMLILFGKCYELIPNDTIGVQTFKRHMGYYGFYSKNHVNKIVFERNNLHIMSNNVKYPLLNKLLNNIRDLKFLNDDRFCITLVKNIIKNESNEAKFIIYSNKYSDSGNDEISERN